MRMAETSIEMFTGVFNNTAGIEDGMPSGMPDQVDAEATEAVSNFPSKNCTALSTLDLTDVVTRLTIGNEEYWGTVSTAWLSVFYVYVIVCCPLLLIVNFRYLWILWKKLRSAKIKNNFAMILICNYCVWSFTGVIHQLLLIIEVNTANQTLAVTSKIFHQLSFTTLINGLTIVAVFEYFLLQYKFGNRSVISYSLCGIPTFLIVVVIIVILLSASGSALIVMVILTMALVLIGVGSSTAMVIMTYRIRHQRLKSLYKVVFTSYIFLMLLSYHLVNALVKVIANKNCVENAQGNRVSWLIIQCIIVLLELIVGYLIADFVKPWRQQGHIQQPHLTINVNSVLQADAFHCGTKSTRDQLLQGIVSDSFEAKVNMTKTIESAATGAAADEFSKLESRPKEPSKETKLREFNDNGGVKPTVARIEYVPLPLNNSIERECFSHSFDTEYSLERNSRLQLEKSGNFYDINTLSYHKPDCNSFTPIPALEFSCRSVRNNASLISTLHVEVVPAHSPVDTDNLIGDIEVGLFDERGGVFHSYKHGVTVVVPTGAIPIGVLAELKFAATLVGNVKFTNKSPVSAIYWLCMDVELQKSIELRLPHFADIATPMNAHNLQFVKSIHSPSDTIEGSMFTIDGGRFPIGEPYGLIQIDHFCYYCIAVNKLERTSIPNNKYSIVAITQRQPEKSEWTAHICILPLIRTCIEKLKGQYGSEWNCQSLSEFSFTQGCDQVSIECQGYNLQGMAEVVLLSNNEIYQQDVDFHHYYESNCLDELRLRMDEKLYPPRFTVVVHAKDKKMFESSRYMNYKLTSGTKTISGKLTMPSIDVFGLSSSGSDSSFKRKKYNSGTSGYRSDDSIEHLPDEHEFVTGG
ncbi:uncharacterized protein [Dysidea avara]|uniref:uncharacterized protein isoform X2 n=1 Tax=Dysidea avara TaxID=196820 RepID=UPI00331AC56C